MLHISEFRVQKYADKGGFPLSLKARANARNIVGPNMLRAFARAFTFYIVYALVFDWLYVRK